MVRVYTYETLDEAIERANALPVGFQAAIFTRDYGTAMPRQAADFLERRRAKSRLSESKKTFYELVERAPFGIYIVDSDFPNRTHERCLANRSILQRKASHRA